MKTQSSTLLSKLKGKGRLAMVNSRSKYCIETTTFTNYSRNNNLRENKHVCTSENLCIRGQAEDPYLTQDRQSDEYKLLLRGWVRVCKFIMLEAKSHQISQSSNTHTVKHSDFQWITSPFFSRATPWHSLISCPICPHRAHGLGLFGLNSSRMIVKLGSCVARPNMIRSAREKVVQST